MSADRKTTQLEDRYATPAGRAARFALPSGRKVRLEPRDSAVAVGWSSSPTPDGIADQVAQVAKSDMKVIVSHATVITRPKSRGNRLASYIRRTAEVDLVRVDGPQLSMVWESGDPSGELTVVAPSWDAISRVASQLGANDVAGAIPGLVSRL